MAETKYGKFIVTELKKNIVEAPWSPPLTKAGGGQGGRILFMDNEVVPGAFYIETVWILPRTEEEAAKRVGTKAHTHDYDEVIAFYGTDPNDPGDLGAEAELWLEDEKHILTRTCMVFVPKGLKHCPLTFTLVDRPVFHFTVGPGKMYF